MQKFDKFYGILFVAMFLGFQGQAQDYQVNGWAIYGNWCGPGHGSGEPIDQLDKLCMEHDQCYQEIMMFSCTCDNEIVLGIENSLYSMSEDEKSIAQIIAGYFSVSPCIDI